jgi:hypothetical protein
VPRITQGFFVVVRKESDVEKAKEGERRKGSPKQSLRGVHSEKNGRKRREMRERRRIELWKLSLEILVDGKGEATFWW